MRSNAYTNCHELMFVFSKGTPNTFNPLIEPTKRNGFEMLITNKKADGINKKVLGQLKETKVKTNIWEYAVGLGGTTNDSIAFKHPAIFPEKLAEDHILSWSNVGDVVLDPMCGSGTTCKMAKMNNRNYIGIDISKEYCEIAMNRLINSYLFSWDDIPGKDKARLIEFLKKRFGIEWLETAKIKKTNSGKTINMFTEDNFLFLELNGEKTKVNLTINDIRTDEFITRVENGSILVC